SNCGKRRDIVEPALRWCLCFWLFLFGCSLGLQEERNRALAARGALERLHYSRVAEEHLLAEPADRGIMEIAVVGDSFVCDLHLFAAQRETALLSWHKDGNVTAKYGPFVDSSVPVYPHDPGAGEWAQDLVLDRSDARFFAAGALGRLAIFMRCLKCFEHHRSVNAFVQLFLGEVLVEATSVNNDSERLFDLRQSAEAAA